ncbi:transcription antitermination factor NusB [Thiohalomonas denitrificans]|uniref:Transcription antitermination protein NusB n=1 Tax=Thiohalomonas denitrificans TaxID=415747 RepID=A0A1G5Q164_9GAMM|nr:transcription antitermination factor NusB [Thiohalomonas denitrificans]SCZ55049.1 NusB antitermination factor [Thiohalomonas denitrificans]
MSRARSCARQRAIQALYQWQVGGQDLADIEADFLAEQDMEGCDLDYFSELLHQIPARLDELNKAIDPCLDRPISQVDPVERAILSTGVYELKFRIDIPYRVVINEAVELAKIFGGEQGHRYVNGILDKVSRTLRKTEVEAARKR